VKLTFNRSDTDTLVIVPEGTLDERNADTLLAGAYRAIDEGATRVIIDCSGLRYIASYGLGTMVRLHKRLAERREGLTLAAVNAHLSTQLQMVRLGDVFRRTATVEAALESPRDSS
jgi:anti-anti-sigma factor